MWIKANNVDDKMLIYVYLKFGDPTCFSKPPFSGVLHSIMKIIEDRKKQQNMSFKTT